MKQMPEFLDERMPSWVINEYDPLLDSSDMQPSDWYQFRLFFFIMVRKKIAEDIAANYDKYNGFVIIHGTDTMAYTGIHYPKALIF